MDALIATLWTFAENHLLTTHNILMALATYVLIWVAEPLVKWAVETRPPHQQVTLWQIQKVGKNFAAILWCEAFVWIPTVQPSLCVGDVHDGCQTVFGRIMTGIVLGGALSLTHKLFLSRLKRRFGVETKEPREVTLRR